MSSMYYGANPQDLRRAFLLRHKETQTEKLMWTHLSQNKLLGFRFRRQHPIHAFVVDFYCHKAKLVIEIDGGYHNRENQRHYDKERTQMLESFGLKELRFTDDDVLNRIDWILDQIRQYLTEARLQARPPLNP